MATARERTQRVWMIQQSLLIWSAFDPPSPADLQEFIRCGVLPQGVTERIAYNPEVEKKMDEIRANGGKLIVEVPNGT